ncbi:hypothetical protein OPT61_g6557 [Boeremia exigua]|uniref:Uncharacterized protein n=1 Tax=Boeremia exigua TaxID=749465 RepID=A0ACC2I5Q9_9PLEO|nr:hypothetical protein OPT61_g6557 [Boeremia exigua]
MNNVINGSEHLIASGCAAPCAGGGDFWHIATAHIVSNHGNAFGGTKLFCFVGADIRGETRYIRLRRLQLLYEYFRHINMQCLLVKFDIGYGENDTHISYEDKLLAKMASFTQKQYERAFEGNAALGGSTWEQIWSGTPAFNGTDIQTPPAIPIPPVIAMLSLHRMTTIVANYIHLDLSEEEKRSRFALVRRYLSGPLDGTQTFERLAEQKLQELRLLVSMEKKERNLPNAKAVLVLYRKGTVNFRQDTPIAIVQQIKDAALRHGIVTIRVAVGLEESELARDDFDLFNVRENRDFVDKQYLAHFWSLVSETGEIFGTAGPRTGSLDVGAFQGVNTFCWDEPILEIIAGDRNPALQKLYPSSYVREQIWQQLLLFQMCGMHNIAVTEPASYVKAVDQFCAIRAKPLTDWLGGKRCIPEIPCTRKAVSLIDYWCRERLENHEIGLQSYNIRKLLKAVSQKTGMRPAIGASKL